MKILAIAFAGGCIQFMVNGFCDLWKSPFSFKTEKEVIIDSQWNCSRCGHSNGDWTSICGKCGRSS